MTYGELNTLTNRMARVLSAAILENNLKGNQEGDSIVAVSMQPSDYLVAVLLAIWKVGAAYLPLDPTFPSARVEHILQESRPLAVVYDEGK